MERRTFVAWVGVGGVAVAAGGLLLGKKRAPIAPVAVGAAVHAVGPGRRYVGHDGAAFDVFPTRDRVDFVARDGRVASSVELRTPVALVVDDDGGVRVLTFDGVVHGFDASGRARGAALAIGLAGASLAGAEDLARGPDGALAVAHTMGHAVVVVDRDGRERARFGRDVLNGLNGPTSVAWRDDRLYVGDIGNRRVVVLDARTGTVARVFEGMRARAVRVDARAHVHVLDRVAGGVHELDMNGAYLGLKKPGPADARVHWLADAPDGALVYSLS